MVVDVNTSFWPPDRVASVARATSRNLADNNMHVLVAASPRRLARPDRPERARPRGRRVPKADRIALAVMARAPSDEGGKTRLLSALRIVDGADLRRAILLDTLDVVGQVKSAQPVVLFTPAAAEVEIADLTGDRWRLTPQRGEDLGQRLENAFTDLLAQNFAGVLIIGSDLPTLPPEYLRRAKSELMTRDDPVVLGPARDGGYNLTEDYKVCVRGEQVLEELDRLGR
jgi:glycosyltransferase A (GT-A) superfamily protein (DUF2064 family)